MVSFLNQKIAFLGLQIHVPVLVNVMLISDESIMVSTGVDIHMHLLLFVTLVEVLL